MKVKPEYGPTMRTTISIRWWYSHACLPRPPPRLLCLNAGLRPYMDIAHNKNKHGHFCSIADAAQNKIGLAAQRRRESWPNLDNGRRRGDIKFLIFNSGNSHTERRLRAAFRGRPARCNSNTVKPAGTWQTFGSFH